MSLFIAVYTCTLFYILLGSFNSKFSVAHDVASTSENHNVLWFLQITDLHFSKFGHMDREEDLLDFCSTYIPVIRPELVLASGDITDAKHVIFPGSSQHAEEWKSYRSILERSGVLDITKWFDIRGNHDSFNVPSSGHSGDYFSEYGVSGKPPKKSYIFKLLKPYGQYSFVSIDMSFEPGVKWPLNFFGYVNLDVKEQFLESVSKAKGSNQTFIFGHYPTSTVVSQDLDFRSFIGANAFAYLCGHLHTLFGMTKRMYVLQPQGFWEWELGDWRSNRYFRIVAIDNDLVSFVDVVKSPANSEATEWPIILITNPKDAQFLLPTKEPVDRILSSKHIRILVWSKWPIHSVSVEIDGVHQGYAQLAVVNSSVQQPLYILPWNASQWSDNSRSMHLIEVTAKDANGNQRTVGQSFSFHDPAEVNTAFLSRYFISTNLSVNVAALYYTLWVLICIFAIVPRFLRGPRVLMCLFRTRFGKGMYRVSSSNRLLSAILIYMLYHISCPMFMGYLVADKFGFVFPYGVFVDGVYLPEKLTYAFASCQLILFSLLLISFYMHCGIRQSDSLVSLDKDSVTEYSTSKKSTLHRHANRLCNQMKNGYSRCIFITVILYTIFLLICNFILVWLPYGFLTVILNPGCILPIVIAWFMYIFCPQPDHVKYYTQ
ncbi:unnamed protein product [Trichobilharzia szidati]|nr:unnamed protein product [Trichobilharzia szidati]